MAIFPVGAWLYDGAKVWQNEVDTFTYEDGVQELVSPPDLTCKVRYRPMTVEDIKVGVEFIRTQSTSGTRTIVYQKGDCMVYVLEEPGERLGCYTRSISEFMEYKPLVKE